MAFSILFVSSLFFMHLLFGAFVLTDSILKSRMWELSCDYRDIIHEFTASDVPSLGHAIYGLNRPFLTRFSGLSHINVDFKS